MFVADYVLMGYGTGAIMAVPGQDQRDWEFAEAFGLPIMRTVQPPDDFDGKAYLGDGPAINSGFLDGLGVARRQGAIIAWLDANGPGEGTVTYKLRDWLFSRQRYWGEPFPIVYDEDDLPIAVPESSCRCCCPRSRTTPAVHLRRRELDARAAVGARARLGRGRAGPGRRARDATGAR